MEAYDSVLAAMKRHLGPSEEIDASKVLVTWDGIYANINGIWTELRPLKKMTVGPSYQDASVIQKRAD